MQCRDGIDHIHAITTYATKHREAAILEIKIRRVVSQIKKPLASGTVRVIPQLCHSDGSTGIGNLKFILHWRVLCNMLSRIPIIKITAPLDNETWNTTMNK